MLKFVGYNLQRLLIFSTEERRPIERGVFAKVLDTAHVTVSAHYTLPFVGLRIGWAN